MPPNPNDFLPTPVYVFLWLFDLGVFLFIVFCFIKVLSPYHKHIKYFYEYIKILCKFNQKL